MIVDREATYLKPHDDDDHPITGDNTVGAPPPSIIDTILLAPTPASITETSSTKTTTCPIPTADVASSGVPSTTTFTTTVPTASNGDSIPTCLQ
ncbi:hypothetical protein SprV_0602077100 [Sparganum proliferum]